MTDLNVSQALGFFTTGLDVEKSKKLMKDIMLNPPKDLSEAYERAGNFIMIDDAMGSLKPQMCKSDRPRDKSYDPRPETRLKTKGSVGDRECHGARLPNG